MIDADEVIDLAESVVLALREFRDATDDEAWDKLFDNEKLGFLLDTVTDLEYCCEQAA